MTISLIKVNTNYLKNQIISVIRRNSKVEALKDAQIAIENNLKVLEITFTTPKANEIISKLSKTQNVFVGAGTVLNKNQAIEAINAKAKFLVSPIYCQDVAKVAKENNILYIPGAFTPSEVFTLLQKGFEIIKVFPASIGNPPYVKALKSVFPSVKLVTTGGVNEINMEDFFKNGVFAIGIGSSLFKGTKEQVINRIETLIGKIKNGKTN